MGVGFSAMAALAQPLVDAGGEPVAERYPVSNDGIRTPHGTYRGRENVEDWAIGLFGVLKKELSCEDQPEKWASAAGQMRQRSENWPDDETYHEIKMCNRGVNTEWCHDFAFGSCERFGSNADALLALDGSKHHLQGPAFEKAQCYSYSVLCCLGSGMFCRCLNPCTACLVCRLRGQLRDKRDIKPDMCSLPWFGESDRGDACGMFGDYCTSCVCGSCAECQITHEIYARRMLPKSYPAEGERSPLVGRNAVPSQLDMADEARPSASPTAAPAPVNTYGSPTRIDDYTRDIAPVGADYRDNKYSLNIDDSD